MKIIGDNSTYKKEVNIGNKMYDFNSMKDLEQKYDTSFYLMDVNKLRSNFNKINKAFKSKYENFIIGYSYKTNYIPFLCKELSKLGAYAEVVSRLEYDLAIKLGEDPKKIIFNGPLKSKNDIFLALEYESIINIDSHYEIDYVKDYALNNPNKQIKIGLRVNFDISDESGASPLQGGFKVSRFGICEENANLKNILNELKIVNNINIVGFHGHFSTSTRTIEHYKKITQKLCQLAKEHIPDTVEFIDVGGGIYGELPACFNKIVPTFEDYAEAICGIMNCEFDCSSKKPALILEPGTAVVANVFLFVAKVIETKTIQNQSFVLVDGSIQNIKATTQKFNLPMSILRQNKHKCSKRLFDIVGYTCMEKDYLAYEIYAKLPEINDYIIFENVGAYTIVFTPPFIKERPAVIAVDNDQVFVVRKKETIRQFFNEELYSF